MSVRFKPRWSRSWSEFADRLFEAVSSPAWWAAETVVVLIFLAAGSMLNMWHGWEIVKLGCVGAVGCLWWAGIAGGAPYAEDPVEVSRKGV